MLRELFASGTEIVVTDPVLAGDLALLVEVHFSEM
jgi:hypothetical protein